MEIVKFLISKDGISKKFVQKTEDGQFIETSYINLDEHIICLSSQIGCPMGCIFCATSLSLRDSDKSFIRNFTADEIVSQAENVLRIISKDEFAAKRILFSYMGMGEPFLNYKNVVESIKILSKKFPNSRTTIATTGIKPDLMKKLSSEKIDTLLKLHLSLHAPNDELRKKLMPGDLNIKRALDALEYFSKKRKVKAKVNYILIKNINDSENHAVQLAKLIQPYPFIIKLSKLNEFNNLKSSSLATKRMFEKILNSYNIETCRYVSDGTDIKSACGQLRRYEKLDYKKIRKK